jgi:hypothetical protein
MNGRTFGIRSISATVLLVFALLPGSAVSQQKSLKEQLVGAWTLVSADSVERDGSRRQNFGPNPIGVFLFDASGLYAQIQMRTDRPKFKAQNRLKGTPEEIIAAWEGVGAHFGTWWVNEADKTIVVRPQGASFPNQEGREAKRIITSLTADELICFIPEGGAGGRVELVYRRAK